MNSNLKNSGLMLICLCFLFFSGEAEEESNVTVNFIDADVRYVLDTLAKQRNINIVLTDNVKGTVNVRFEDVPFWDAFEAVLAAKGLGYEKIGEIIKVATLEELESHRKKEDKRVRKMEIKTFFLKYVNAEEVEKVIKKLLSPNGSVNIFYGTIRSGWPIAGISEDGQMGIVPRTDNKQEEFPRVLIIRDFPENIQKITELIKVLDIAPKQVFIEAMVVEIYYDDERDIGINWEALGQTGATDSSFVVGEGRELAGKIEGGEVDEPSTDFSGLTLTYRRLVGAAYKAELHALEEEGRANILSNPKLLVIDGHEATILVGKKYPILTVDISEEGRVTSEQIDHYEQIGVTLKVVPLVLEGSRINMIIHPAVTALGDDVTGSLGLVVKEIVTREVDTNIAVNSGDTISIGGLIDYEEKLTQYKVPLLGDIPILGLLFRRENKTVKKIELLIFITPTVVEEPELTTRDKNIFLEKENFLKKAWEKEEE